MLAVRWTTRTKALETLASRYPYVAMILIAVTAYAASQTTRRLGLTEIFGAVLVGFALPGGGAWAGVSHQLGRLGRLLLPVMFTLTGTALAAGVPNLVSWEAIAVAVAGVAVAARSVESVVTVARCHMAVSLPSGECCADRTACSGLGGPVVGR